MPALRRDGVRLRGVVTASGHTAFHAGRKYGFEYAASDVLQLLDDPTIDGVIITTRHDLHASLVAQALRAGKAVFVEKPLAVDREDLHALVDAWQLVRQETGAEPRLMVGFNRRYSPLASRLRQRLDQITEPLAVACRVNAGPVPSESWVHDRREGGGRVIGEVCHFVDLIQYLTGALPVGVYATGLNVPGYGADENVVVTLHMDNGSVGTISYLASGDKSFARERVEVLGGGAVGVLDNFRSVEFVRGGRRSDERRWRLEKGYSQELDAFLHMVRGDTVPVPFAEHVATTIATFAIEESMAAGSAVAVQLPFNLEQQP
jgi:predicted dehydrogenase